MRNFLTLVILVILAIYGNADAQHPQRPQRPTRPQFVTIKNNLLDQIRRKIQIVSGKAKLTDCTTPSIKVNSKIC